MDDRGWSILTSSGTELYFLTIAEAGLLIRDRQISPVELTRAFLERIQAVDGILKSYLTVTADLALAQARAAEAEILAGRRRGPLHGIPIALKDLFDTAGIRTTAQSKVLEHRVPAQNATVVDMLYAAGAVLLGKLAMHEFALGGPPTSLFEQARNPWDQEYVTGGSSTGSGAAVAAGLCMGSLGSDTGGSIRGPASLCGIVGLKPTYGRVSRAGVLPLAWTLDHCGPMTWTVKDTALLLEAISGHDPKDPTSSHAPVPRYAEGLERGVKGLVVGVPRSYAFDTGKGIDKETVAAVDKALAELEGLGARVEEVEIPMLHQASPATTVIMLSEAFAYHRANLATQLHNYGDVLWPRFLMGGIFTSGDYVQAQRVRSVLKRQMAETLQKVDVLVTPTSFRPAGKYAEFDPLAGMDRPSFTGPYNQTGLPAISIPCGFNALGLPIGLQIAGKPFDEVTVLRAAYSYEQQARWIDRRPVV
jgi:aspartyl-tRNA(Asn)/glutamyl-tRNA(Gln) amidotransferase subunit A